MIRDNTDCPYLHDIFDQYCNLFKGYKNCGKNDCEVLKILKENEQLKNTIIQPRKQIDKIKNCSNCNGIIKGGIRTEKCKLCIKDKDFRYWERAE